jgi:thioredoxin 1
MTLSKLSSVALLIFVVAGCQVSDYQQPVSTTSAAAQVNSDTVKVTDQSFVDIVAQSDQPVLIDFWAPWCGPCRQLGPTIENLATRYKGRVIVGKLDVDEAPTVSSEYGISSIPTILFFERGEEVQRVTGVRSEAQLASIVDSLLEN